MSHFTGYCHAILYEDVPADGSLGTCLLRDPHHTVSNPMRCQGGNLIFGASEIDAVSAAIADFNAKNTDPKIAVNAIFQNSPADGPGVLVNLFYNAPTPPAGLFDAFLALSAVSSTISTRSLLSLVEEIQFPVAPRCVAAVKDCSIHTDVLEQGAVGPCSCGEVPTLTSSGICEGEQREIACTLNLFKRLAHHLYVIRI